MKERLCLLLCVKTQMKMWQKYIYLYILISSLVVVLGNNKVNSKKDENTFVPTHEWQVVKKGQAIPKGLHVRINFETGVTEAKLTEDVEVNKPVSALVEIREKKEENAAHPDSPSTPRYMLQEELMEALQNFNDDDKIQIDPEEIKKVKDQFRSYDELKKELGDLKLTSKTDAEIIEELVERHIKFMKTKQYTDDDLLFIMQDLEYLVHQIDNANEFVRQNGFQIIVYKNLNSSNERVRREALHLLGSAVQNNPKVQIHALETGSIPILSRVLAAEEKKDNMSKAVFALSCLLRRFPLAQKMFLQNGGMSILSDILNHSDDVKLKIKIITLVHDLILEHEHARQYKDKEKLRQYNEVSIKSKLKELNWCNYLVKSLVNAFEIDNTDHDLIEKCLNAILLLLDSCRITLNANQRMSFARLREQYKLLGDNEETETESEYFTNLYKSTDKIYRNFGLHAAKTEL